MTRLILITHSAPDSEFAHRLDHALTAAGFSVTLDNVDALAGIKSAKELDRSITNARALLAIISPESATSDTLMRHVSLARQYERDVLTIVAHPFTLPWYLADSPCYDFSTNWEEALTSLIQNIPIITSNLTFGEARNAYLHRATLKSEHTLAAYQRALELFMDFLGDRTAPSHRLPIQQQAFILPDEIPLAALGEHDAPIFLHFAEWLLSPSSGKTGDKRPYSVSTVQLRLAGVQNWFQFLDDHGWLPTQFHLAKAKRIMRDELRGHSRRSSAPQPPEHIEEVIYYYDHLEMPANLRQPNTNPERIERWTLTRLRNRALMHSLAETGGRISEILSLNLSNFPARHLQQDTVLRIEVTGKGGHSYPLRFLDSLPAIRAYIHSRGANLRSSVQGDIPLFVSHDPQYDRRRMSRIVAWRVVHRAARALGLADITPHDFRHWRATQLINAGHPLDVVQDYLGHRSVETTRSYYARTDPLRVDEAAKHTRLPSPDNDQS